MPNQDLEISNFFFISTLTTYVRSWRGHVTSREHLKCTLHPIVGEIGALKNAVFADALFFQFKVLGTFQITELNYCSNFVIYYY